jgi:hypothetical protein
MSLAPTNGSILPTVAQKATTVFSNGATVPTVFYEPDSGETIMDKGRLPVFIHQPGSEKALRQNSNSDTVIDGFGPEEMVGKKINLPLAIQQLDRTTSLVLLPLPIDLPGDEVIKEMKQIWLNISVARPFLQKTLNLLSAVVVGTAIVRQVRYMNQFPN